MITLCALWGCMTLSRFGLYQNRCRPIGHSVTSFFFSYSSSQPPPSTEPIGKAPPLPSLFPVPCHLVQVCSSFCVMLSMFIQKKIRWEIEVTFLVNGFFLGNVRYFTNRRGGWEWENMFFPATNILF